MFLYSVASELSNYDSCQCQSAHFCVLTQLSFCLVLLSMEGQYAVKLSITDLIKISRK